MRIAHRRFFTAPYSPRRDDKIEPIYLSSTSSLVGDDCLYASMMNAFLTRGYEATEADIYFFTGGLNIEYHPTLNYFDNPVDKTMQTLPEAGITCTKQAKTTPEAFIRYAQQVLQGGDPLLLYLSSKDLSYHKIFAENPPRDHYLLLTGIDPASSQLMVLDSHFKEYKGITHKYHGLLPFDEVYNNLFCTYHFDFHKSTPMTKTHVFQKLLQNLDAVLEGDEKANVCYGRRAFEAYIDDFKRLQTLDRPAFEKQCHLINFNLWIFFVRSLEYVITLLNENPCLHFGEQEALMADIKAVVTGWNKVIMMVLKTQMLFQAQKVLPCIDKAHAQLQAHMQCLERVRAHILALPGLT